MKNVLTIAGSDPSGGAGIQADLKTMGALGVFGMSAITALTVQNTREVRAVAPVSGDMVAKQIEAVFDDITVDAVKVGMIVNAEIAQAVTGVLRARKARNVVVDPVMVAKSGGRLIDDDAVKETLRLAEIATVVTPNLLEAALLADMEINTHADMEEAARKIQKHGVRNVMVKGGANRDDADDYLLADDAGFWLRCPRVPTENVHGAGCTLSSAIACRLALGKDIGQSVRDAKNYVTQAIRDSFRLGGGGGPLGHFAGLYRRAGMNNE